MKKTMGFSFCCYEDEGCNASGTALVAGLLFFGLGSCLWSGLGLQETGSSPLPLLLAGLIYCAAGCRLPRRLLAFQLTAAAGLMIYTVAVSRFIISGWNVVMNSVFQRLELRLGYIFSRLEITAAGLPAKLCAELFLGLCAVLLGLLCARAAGGKKGWLVPVWGLTAALWAAGATFLYPPDFSWVLLTFGLAMLTVWQLARKNPDAGGAPLALATALQMGFALLLCAALALACGDGEASAWSMRRAAERAVHRMRYETTQTTMPEGALHTVGDFEPAEETALTITIEKPQELYLRGYVGEAYTGSGWTALKPEERAEYATLFAWLHERGFYGQTQFSALCRAVGAAKKSNSISLEVRAACTAWRYTPYGVDGIGPDARRIGDADWPASGLHGERVYSCEMSACPISDYEQLAERLTQARKSGSQAAVAYLSGENAYREFVYGSYLAVPEKANAAIAAALAGLELPQGGEVSFRDAQTVVRAYLSSAATYREDPQAIRAGQDFVYGFLQETKEGYSVHYATAAALMFRYLGVPARYVEGWYIPPEKAQQIQPGEPVELDQSFAHAWVEIYRDGVGFVPFEITTPYTDPNDRQNTVLGGSGGAEVPPPSEDVPPPAAWQITLCAALILLGVMCVLAIAAAVRRAVKRRRVDKMLHAADAAQAVCNMTAWSVTLLRHLGLTRENESLSLLAPEIERLLGGETAVQFEAVLTLQRRAAFGPHGISEADRDVPARLVQALENKLRHTGSAPARLRLRWVDCVI